MGKVTRGFLQGVVAGTIEPTQEQVLNIASELLSRRGRTSSIISKVADLRRVVVEGAEGKWEFEEGTKVFRLRINNHTSATVRIVDGGYGNRWKWEIFQNVSAPMVVASGTTFSATNARRRVEDVICSMAKDVNVKILNEEIAE